jgi:hypothetical protein
MSSLACKNVKIQDTNGNVASTITWDGNNVTFDKPVLAPTAAAGTNNTQVATTAMVHSAITNDLHVTGSAPMYACRAWVNFDGTQSTPAIRACGNVSSVTKNGTGDYMVNIATAMPDANYTTCITIGGTNSTYSSRTSEDLTARTSSAFRMAVLNTNNNAADSQQVNISIFR